jgi:hypothetical protein
VWPFCAPRCGKRTQTSPTNTKGACQKPKAANIFQHCARASVFTLLRRDVFAVLFFLASLTGIRAFVPGLVAFGVVVANFTFSRYDEELAAAAEERLSSLLP